MAETYDDWRADALAADERSGAERWKHDDRSRYYDYRVIRRRHEELAEIRASGDTAKLLYYLSEGVHGNMGGMGAPGLYRRARFGTKHLVGEFTRELTGALLDLEASTEVPLSTKQLVLERASLCFGRTALMLSGAGSLGPFHSGVVRTLEAEDLLPDVISGASAGALVTAIIGTRPKEDLARAFETSEVQQSFEQMRTRGSRTGSWSGRRTLRNSDLYELIDASVPDMTFAEAEEESGKKINISIAPIGVHQRSRLLSAITSPNALVRDAVRASTAIPGLFPPVTLHARDDDGTKRPYVPSRKWIDGSITGDLPARRLSRLYAVNHFISSQANPLVLWAVQSAEGDDLWSRYLAILQAGTREWMRAVYPVMIEPVRNIYPLNIMTRMFFSVATQEYVADINISPRSFYNPSMFLSVLSEAETEGLIREGEQATWPRIEMIRNATRVSRCIDAIRDRLAGSAA